MKDQAYWIKKLDLKKHPEGGYFRRTYQSNLDLEKNMLPASFAGSRSITAIYYLLSGDEISAIHRLHSDEMWHFYYGDTLTLHIIDLQSNYFQIKLGQNSENNEFFQTVVKAGWWFGATINNPFSYALVGCTVAPGFDFQDFEMGKREDLLKRYPQHSKIIEILTNQEKKNI